MALDLAFPTVAFLIAAVFGVLGWVSKHVWQNRRLTQTFVMIAVIATLALMGWALVALE